MTDATTLPTSQDGDDAVEDVPDVTEDIDQEAADTSGERKWEREVAKAEAEADGVDKSVSKPPLYCVSVLAFAEGDQNTIYQALSKWSPIKKTSQGTKLHRSVTAHVQPNDIANLMTRLGEALAGDQPRKVRISIEA